MKTLKNCVKLSCSVKIYVPSTVEVDKEFDSQEYVERTLKFLSSEFGGATATKALGAWVTSSGALVKESVTMVFAYTGQQQLEKSIDSVYDFCLAMKKELAQEAIALEVNNELYLV